MGISVIGAAASSGGSGSNQFLLDMGNYTNNTAELSKEYPAGSYSISVDPADATIDYYFVAKDGSNAGYSNTASIIATSAFNKVVVLGSQSAAKISFSYSGESAATSTSGQLPGAGAFVTSVATSSLPTVDGSTVIAGGNFADNVEVTFIGQDAASSPAKSVVKTSTTELLATRPDDFSPDNSPFTVKVVNPGIPLATGSSSHLLSNSVTAGTNPVWTTGASIYYNIGAATSITLLATDTEATDIDYSIISGSLPSGLSLDNETGIISGTFSGSAAANDSNSVTFRAIDTGGNFLDKAVNMIANTAPTWTGASSLYIIDGFSSSIQLTASSAVAANVLTYSLISGSLFSGMSINTAGTISGTNSANSGDTSSAVIRVSDPHGLSADQTFNFTSGTPITGGTLSVSGGYAYHTFNTSGTLTIAAATAVEFLVVGGGSNSSGGPSSQGGGGGGVNFSSATLSPGTLSATVGAANGGNSSFNSVSATAASGTSSGTGNHTSYAPGQNTYGGTGHGGGGGAGGNGLDMTYRWGGNGGPGQSWVDGNFYGGGGGGGTGWSGFEPGYGGSGVGAGRTAAVPNSGGGGAGTANGYSFTAGAAGVVKIRYAV